MKRIFVPEGLSEEVNRVTGIPAQVCELACKTVLGWISEKIHSIYSDFNKPFGSTSKEAVDTYSHTTYGARQALDRVCATFEREEDGIEDLLRATENKEMILEAYARGMRRGSKNG